MRDLRPGFYAPGRWAASILVEGDRDGDAATDDAAWIADLERRGTLRRATAVLPRTWLARRPKVKRDVVGALLDERDDGR
jgi:hypothetical protein